MRARLAAALVLAVTVLPAHRAPAEAIHDAELSAEQVEVRVGRLLTGPDTALLGEPVLDAGRLSAFYAHRDYRPAWLGFDRDVAVGPSGLARVLEGARDEGLDPELFHHSAVHLLLQRNDWGPDEALALELLLSDGLLALAEVYARGTPGLNDPILDPNLPLGRPVSGAMVSSIAEGEVAPERGLDALLPTLSDYRRLRALLPAAPPEAGRAVRVTLARMRALPRGDGATVLVNIPEFRLELREGDQPVRSMAVIVGMKSRRTPVLSDRIERIVINPRWSVPSSIARKDILPKVRRSEDYLTTRGIRVLRGYGKDAELVDPATVDWDSLQRMGGLRFEQRPGSRNALGRLKFLFPNPIAVYLHDTPDRHLFARENRARSSGCVRVEDAAALASALLPAPWDREALEEAIAGGRSKSVKLGTPVPVHLVYWTARAGPDGELQVFEDLYGWDEAAEEAIRRQQPDG